MYILSWIFLKKNSKFAANSEMIPVLAVTSAINGWGSLLSEDHKEILAQFITEIVFELKILNINI